MFTSVCWSLANEPIRTANSDFFSGMPFASGLPEAGMKPSIQHIVVPTNFGIASRSAVAYGASIARSAGARLHLVHVLEQPFSTSGHYQFHLPDTPARREHRYQEALAELKRLASFVYGVEVSLEVREGTVIEAITKAALDYGANLIVVGTYRHGALKRYITGNIVDHLLPLAPCPVLAVGNDHASARFRQERLVA
jgi:nucleotide-binding universal stress UspA family protein